MKPELQLVASGLKDDLKPSTNVGVITALEENLVIVGENVRVGTQG